MGDSPGEKWGTRAVFPRFRGCTEFLSLFQGDLKLKAAEQGRAWRVPCFGGGPRGEAAEPVRGAEHMLGDKAESLLENPKGPER